MANSAALALSVSNNGFHEDHVHAALQQRGHLLGVRGAHLIEGYVPARRGRSRRGRWRESYSAAR